MAYHIVDSDLGHTHSKQQLDKNLKIHFASPSKSTDKKEEEKKKDAGDDLSVCVFRVT